MLPELTLLHEGSVSTSAPVFRTFPARAPYGPEPSARDRAQPPIAVKERTVALELRPGSRAPRWSMLALQRELELQRRRGLVPRDELGGVARRVLAPLAVGAATVVGLVALGGLLVALGIVATIAFAFAIVARLQVTRRWCERQRLLQLEHDALRLRARMVAKLHREHREELECLVALVENVREHEAMRFGSRRASSILVARLDALLFSYVERAIEVRGVAAGFAVTVDDEPKLIDTEPDDREGEPERRRALQIVHLRRRAREMCRRRIERMEGELACIGQLVRLVHEQALASALTHDELSGLLADVLDEAEHARQAREEVEATLSDRAIRGEPILSPLASASFG